MILYKCKETPAILTGFYLNRDANYQLVKLAQLRITSYECFFILIICVEFSIKLTLGK